MIPTREDLIARLLAAVLARVLILAPFIVGALWTSSAPFHHHARDRLATARGPACRWTGPAGELCSNAATCRGLFCHQHAQEKKP